MHFRMNNLPFNLTIFDQHSTKRSKWLSSVIEFFGNLMAFDSYIVLFMHSTLRWRFRIGIICSCSECRRRVDSKWQRTHLPYYDFLLFFFPICELLTRKPFDFYSCTEQQQCVRSRVCGAHEPARFYFIYSIHWRHTVFSKDNRVIIACGYVCMSVWKPTIKPNGGIRAVWWDACWCASCLFMFTALLRSRAQYIFGGKQMNFRFCDACNDRRWNAQVYANPSIALPIAFWLFAGKALI